jgi:hypothetical protein
MNIVLGEQHKMSIYFLLLREREKMKVFLPFPGANAPNVVAAIVAKEKKIVRTVVSYLNARIEPTNFPRT